MRRGGDRNIGSVCRLPRLSCNQKSQQIKFETLLLKVKDKHNSNMIQFCAAICGTFYQQHTEGHFVSPISLC